MIGLRHCLCELVRGELAIEAKERCLTAAHTKYAHIKRLGLPAEGPASVAQAQDAYRLPSQLTFATDDLPAYAPATTLGTRVCGLVAEVNLPKGVSQHGDIGLAYSLALSAIKLVTRLLTPRDATTWLNKPRRGLSQYHLHRLCATSVTHGAVRSPST